LENGYNESISEAKNEGISAPESTFQPSSFEDIGRGRRRLGIFDLFFLRFAMSESLLVVWAITT
jgi:hypothetical protein